MSSDQTWSEDSTDIPHMNKVAGVLDLKLVLLLLLSVASGEFSLLTRNVPKVGIMC